MGAHKDHLKVCTHHTVYQYTYVQSILKMQAVLCVAVVLCLAQCFTAIPVEEFVGYPFSNETHQVFRVHSGYYNIPVNIAVPFIIAGEGSSRFVASHMCTIVKRYTS